MPNRSLILQDVGWLGIISDESVRHNRGRLQASQKPEKLIIRLVTKTSAIRRCGFAEGPFFHCKVGVEIDLCSLDGFVSKPQRDHGSVDPCLKQLHCSGVSKHVWAYSPCIESLAIVLGCERVFCDQVLNRIGAQSTSSTIRHSSRGWISTPSRWMGRKLRRVRMFI